MQKTEVAVGQWISVEEHLPEDTRKVLVCGTLIGNFVSSAVPALSIGSFNPKKGWRSSIGEVEYWTEMPHLPISEESIRDRIEDDLEID